MVAVTQTTTTQLTSPADISAYLGQSFASPPASPFSPGQAVTIVSRPTLPAELGAGNVGRMVLCPPTGSYCWILVLATSGVSVVVQVPTGSLAAA